MPFRSSVLLLLIAVYLAVGLQPFHWQPPQLLENGARVGEPSGVGFPRPGQAYYVGRRDWVATARRSGELHLDLRLRSLRSEQFGPARILSISADNSLRNMTIAQESTALVVRLRRPESTLNGTPSYRVESVFLEPLVRDVSISIANEVLHIAVDGAREEFALGPSPLRNWDPSFEVVLGNETTGARPWLGEILRAEARVGERRVNLLEASRLQVPERVWVNWHVRGWTYLRPVNFDQEQALDMLLNLLGFLPLGFALALARRERLTLLRTVLGCLALSASIECLQLAFEPRTPSVIDLACNTLGGLAGWMLATWTARRIVPEPPASS